MSKKSADIIFDKQIFPKKWRPKLKSPLGWKLHLRSKITLQDHLISFPSIFLPFVPFSFCFLFTVQFEMTAGRLWLCTWAAACSSSLLGAFLIPTFSCLLQGFFFPVLRFLTNCKYSSLCFYLFCLFVFPSVLKLSGFWWNSRSQLDASERRGHDSQ